MNSNPTMVFLNRSFDKKRLKALLLWFRLNLSEGAALKAVEILQGLGFRSATQGAISLGLDDLKTPASKGGRVFQAQLEVALAHHEHHRGNRTPVELFQHLVDTWHRTSQDLTAEVVQLFHSTERVNPVYMMAFSGARGNISQVRQLVGMRGLMADPRGQIVGFPILSNFREGLTITEYFVSCYGARKGVVDTAIRTADAGYLTRRLADVSHHVVVRTTNCGTHRNIRLRNIKEGQKTILSLSSRLVGRVLAETPGKFASRNEEITPDLASKLAAEYSEISVRSPLSCSLRWGVCQLCYGWGLSEGRRVTLGEAVGIIAAQSIGEPGTQLTLRTFHTGGVFSGDLLNEIRAPYAGTILFPEPLQGLLVRTPHGQIAFLAKVSGKMIVSSTPHGILGDRVNANSTDLALREVDNSYINSTDSSDCFASPDPYPYPQLPSGTIDSVKNVSQSLTRLGVKKRVHANNQSIDVCYDNEVDKGKRVCNALTLTHFSKVLGVVIIPNDNDSKNGTKTLASNSKGLVPLRGKKQASPSPSAIQPITKSETAAPLHRPLVDDRKQALQSEPLGESLDLVTKSMWKTRNEAQEFALQPSTVVFVRQKEQVYQNQLLAEFSSSNLKPTNDQIEVTQQVLSEAAGQVWFKKIHYGNRKGPGSGSLGTHFSSQKLGSIWVLAGKPMSTVPAFNDRRLFPLSFRLGSYYETIGLNNALVRGKTAVPFRSPLGERPKVDDRKQARKSQPSGLAAVTFHRPKVDDRKQDLRGKKQPLGNGALIPLIPLLPSPVAEACEAEGTIDSKNFYPFTNPYGLLPRKVPTWPGTEQQIIAASYIHRALQLSSETGSPKTAVVPQNSTRTESVEQGFLQSSGQSAQNLKTPFLTPFPSNRFLTTLLTLPSPIGLRSSCWSIGNFFGHEKFFTTNCLQWNLIPLGRKKLIEENILKSYKNSILSLQHDYHFLKYHYSLGYSQLTDSANFFSINPPSSKVVKIHRGSGLLNSDLVNNVLEPFTLTGPETEQLKALLTFIGSFIPKDKVIDEVNASLKGKINVTKNDQQMAHTKGIKPDPLKGKDSSVKGLSPVPKGLRSRQVVRVKKQASTNGWAQREIASAWEGGYGFRKGFRQLLYCVNSMEFLSTFLSHAVFPQGGPGQSIYYRPFTSSDKESRSKNNLALGDILRFHNSTMGTADKAHVLLETQIARKTPVNTPLVWWLPRKWKTAPGMLLEEPLFSNKEKTKGQRFWLLRSLPLLIPHPFHRLLVDDYASFSGKVNDTMALRSSRINSLTGIFYPIEQNVFFPREIGMSIPSSGDSAVENFHSKSVQKLKKATNCNNFTKVVTKLFQPVDLNCRKCSVTNRGVFSPLHQSYTFDSFMALMCKGTISPLKGKGVASHSDPLNMAKQPSWLSKIAQRSLRKKGLACFSPFKGASPLELANSPLIQRVEDTTISSVSLPALWTQTEETLTKHKINKLLTINSFWQALSLTHYPNQVSSPINRGYPFNRKATSLTVPSHQTPFDERGMSMGSEKSNDGGLLNKSIGFADTFSNKLVVAISYFKSKAIEKANRSRDRINSNPGVGWSPVNRFQQLNAKSLGKNENFVNNPAHFPVKARDFSKVTFDSFCIFPNRGKEKGKNQIVSVHKPIWLSVHMSSNNYNDQSIPTKSIGFTFPFSRKIVSTNKMWQMRNILKIGTKKKRIERNDGTLDQHIVHTFHLPIVPFPYIIQPHGESIHFLSNAFVETVSAKSVFRAQKRGAEMAKSIDKSDNDGGKFVTRDLLVPLRGKKSIYSRHSNIDAKGATLVPSSSNKGNGCEQPEANVFFTPRLRKTYGVLPLRAFSPQLRKSGPSNSLAVLFRSPLGERPKVDDRKQSQIASAYGVFPEQALETESIGSLGVKGFQLRKPLGTSACFFPRKGTNPLGGVNRSHKTVEEISRGLKGSTSTSYHTNCGTPVHGNLLPLIRQNLWEENCNKCIVSLAKSMKINSASAVDKLNRLNYLAKLSLHSNIALLGDFLGSSTFLITKFIDFDLSKNELVNSTPLWAKPNSGVINLHNSIINLRAFDMEFVISLPMRTITNLQGRYTSVHLKLPNNAVTFTSTFVNEGTSDCLTKLLTVPSHRPKVDERERSIEDEMGFFRGKRHSEQTLVKPMGGKTLNSTLHPLYGDFSRFSQAKFGVMPPVGTFPKKISEKNSSSLQEIPHTSCFRLMRRIMEYSVELDTSTCNLWLTNRNKRKKLQYSPFSIGLPNDLIGEKLYKFYPLEKRNNLEKGNFLTVKNKIFVGKKKFTNFSYPIYLNWYSCDSIDTPSAGWEGTVNTFAMKIQSFGTLEELTARFLKLLQTCTIKFPKGEVDTRGLHYTQSIDIPLNETVAAKEALRASFPSDEVNRTDGKRTRFSGYRKNEFNLPGVSVQVRKSSLSKPLLSESDQATFAADEFVDCKPGEDLMRVNIWPTNDKSISTVPFPSPLGERPKVDDWGMLIESINISDFPAHSQDQEKQVYNTFNIFPGQLVAYGETISGTNVTTESGQVLYVDSQKTTLRKAQTVLIYSQAIIAVLSGEWIKKGTPLMALSYQKLVTGDIVQGLPKIEQFFEAPVLKDGTFWSDSLQAKLNQFFQEHREQLPLAEAVRKGFSEIQRVLIEGVQRVYISQGVLIADKHLEVIVRQMTCKGRILYSGDTGFLRNELVSLDKIESVNQVTYGQKALYHPQVRGITDASLESESFLSAASFQETTRVLSRDAIIGKTDLMRGLKERVIVGELIQAGTGLANNTIYNLL